MCARVRVDGSGGFGRCLSLIGVYVDLSGRALRLYGRRCRVTS